jgi:hypothetical protein
LTGVRSFTFGTTGRRGHRRWFWARIHADAQQLRLAAGRLRPGEDFSECYGCLHPVPDPAPANGLAGTLRLAASYLQSEVIAHELVHAALVVYRLNIRPDVRLGTGCGQREEDLAYIYGELFADFEQHFNH